MKKKQLSENFVPNFRFNVNLSPKESQKAFPVVLGNVYNNCNIYHHGEDEIGRRQKYIPKRVRIESDSESSQEQA